MNMRVLLLIALGAVAGPAAADTMLISETNLVSGSQSMTQAFTVTAAGTVTVQFSNIAWPQALTSLTFLATTASQVLGSWDVTSSGLATFKVSGPGTYYAHVTGTAGGPLELGLYSLNLSFQAASVPVPLPPSVWLLLLGLVMSGLAVGRAQRASPLAVPAAA